MCLHGETVSDRSLSPLSREAIVATGDQLMTSPEGPFSMSRSIQPMNQSVIMCDLLLLHLLRASECNYCTGKIDEKTLMHMFYILLSYMFVLCLLCLSLCVLPGSRQIPPWGQLKVEVENTFFICYFTVSKNKNQVIFFLFVAEQPVVFIRMTMESK